ncbi:hypothetical protein HNQ51_002194 [Inhella inkyongensis]|uniref:Uncharacterized protein n=1 Tax=Inhella inkyongensis TaxID=392593 RepID=A0A840S3G2_9BURK|nr:hypothetical protein [Inhella inkyongensis]MBB5204875.1 hypothetical protein [Inhella inkyongensis]
MIDLGRFTSGEAGAIQAVVGACMHKLAMLIYVAVRSGLSFDPRIAMPKLDFQGHI